MTTLYRAVLIESAEQAEALHEGTALLGTSDLWPIELNDEGLWGNDGITLSHEEVVGRTALVPIEAERETVVATADLPEDRELWLSSDDMAPELAEAIQRAPKQTRLVTRWEDG